MKQQDIINNNKNLLKDVKERLREIDKEFILNYRRLENCL